jgi:hypothetical protein
MKSIREWLTSFSRRGNVFMRRHAVPLTSLGLLASRNVVFFFDRTVASLLG